MERDESSIEPRDLTAGVTLTDEGDDPTTFLDRDEAVIDQVKSVTGEDVKLIPVDKLRPNEWNPQEMTDEEFNALVEEIREDGFDEPILVVPDPKFPAADGRFMIVAGQHRFEACRVLGLETVPAFVKENWDETAQKVKTIRRNLLHGSLNNEKFSLLVNELRDAHQVSMADMPRVLGFRTTQEFGKHYKEEKEKKEKEIAAQVDDTKAELEMIDNLSMVLNSIFSEYGDTVPQGFLFFMYKKHLHLLVKMNDQLQKMVDAMAETLKTTGGSANQFLIEAIRNQLERMKSSSPSSVPGAIATGGDVAWGPGGPEEGPGATPSQPLPGDSEKDFDEDHLDDAEGDDPARVE